MGRKTRSINRLSKMIKESSVSELDKEGRPVINISVSNDSHFVSDYFTDGKPQLTQETAGFLEHSIKHVKSDNQIVFNITSSVIDEDEQVKYKRAVKNYYAQEISEVVEELKTNTKMSLVMTIVGVLVFVANLVLNHFIELSILMAVLDVVAWVFVWEAVDIFFFRRHEIKQRLKKCVKLLTAEINFN